MFKKFKSLLIGTLALGLFLGSSSFINPYMASAATNGNQVTTGSQLFTGEQQQPTPTVDNQPTNVPNNGTQQPLAKAVNDLSKQGLSQQYDQQMCLSFDRIISRAAKLMGISKKAVLTGLKDGDTLVEIAVDNGITNKTTLAKLRLLQKEINYFINIKLPNTMQRNTFFNQMNVYFNLNTTNNSTNNLGGTIPR